MTSRKKVTYIVSNVDKSLAFEWVAERLDKARFEVSFVLLNAGETELERFCQRTGTPCRRITYRGKKDIPRALLTLFAHLWSTRPHVVHCHMFDAYVIGMIAARLALVRRRVYTRHNATYHRTYYPDVVKFDRLTNRLSSCVVAPSKNVARVLVRDEHVPDHKVRLIHHGFELDRFAHAPPQNVESLAARCGTVGKYPVIGVIARYHELKGLQYVIPAWKRLREEYPESHLILANARGPHAPRIAELLSDVPESAYTELPFENDIFSLYQLLDIHVHAPIDAEIEAFGQTYVEALASGTPSVFTLSGVAPEFIRHERNALVVPFAESEPIYAAMKRILIEPELRESMVAQGKIDVEPYRVDSMIGQFEELYSE